MKTYIEMIYKYKKSIAVIIVITILLSIYGITRIQLNTDFSLFSSNDSVYEDRLVQLEEQFGELNQITVLVASDEFDDELRQDLYEIERFFEEVDGVLQIQGVAPEQLMIAGVATDYQDVPVPQIEQYYERFEEFSPIVIDDGVYYFNYTLFIDDTFTKDNLNAIEDQLSLYAHDYYISGDEYSQIKITDYIIRILFMLPPLALLIIFVVFRYQMKNIKATIFSVLPAAVGSLWTLGIVGLLGNEVSMLTAVVPIFIIVIGSADGLHFLSHFQDLKSEGYTTKDALIKDLKIVGIPMIVTTLTSMIGFISLLTMNTSSIVDLAIFSAVGIMLAGVATWTVIPFILSNDIHVQPHKKETKRRDLSVGLKRVWGYPSIIVVVIILIVATLFVSSINHEFDMLMVYKDSTEVKQNADQVSTINGGSIPLYISIDLDQSPITIDSKEEVDSFVAQLQTDENVVKIISPYRMFDILYGLQFPGDIDNDMVLTNLYTTISQDENNVVHNLINTDDNVVRLLVFSSDLENDTLLQLEDVVNETDNASITGVQYLLMDLNTSIGTMQLNSIVVAILIVIVLMIISLRNIKIAVISVIPIVITVIALYGFLGVSQIPLNITTVMIFSITIGVGIDYAVHYSSVYQYYKKEGRDNSESIQLSFDSASRPILANAIGISLGLSIMMLSPLRIHFNVSILMWISMIVSVFVTLTFLPTVFHLFDRRD